MRGHLRNLMLAMLVFPIALCGADRFAGTWKLNLDKSKDATDHPRLPKSETITVEEQDGGLKISNDQVNASGKSVQFGYTAKFDGNDYPVTGNPGVDMVSLKKSGSSKLVATNKKDGKVVNTITSVISKDGKTRTSSLAAKDASGQPVTWTAVFEKQ